MLPASYRLLNVKYQLEIMIQLALPFLCQVPKYLHQTGSIIFLRPFRSLALNYRYQLEIPSYDCLGPNCQYQLGSMIIHVLSLIFRVPLFHSPALIYPQQLENLINHVAPFRGQVPNYQCQVRNMISRMLFSHSQSLNYLHRTGSMIHHASFHHLSLHFKDCVRAS